MSVLVLGGTREARDVALELHAAGVEFVSSLAGRVRRPRMPVGETRTGGFGGATGLAAHLRTHRVAAVVDATHPFAATISANAALACRRAGVPLLRLARPGWSDEPGAARWHWADDHDDAAGAAARLGDRVLLTTGRRHLARFTGPLGRHHVLVRVVDDVEEPLPAGWRVLLDRGPYRLDDERDLLREQRIEVLVTKDSGGGHTRAKLDAADQLGVAVVVVRRPASGEPVETVSDVDAVLRWLRRQD